MKNRAKIILTSVLLLSIGSSVASADVAKGQKLYLKKLKGACSMNGAEMAAKHSQMEWEQAKNSLAKEIKNICPKAKDSALKEKYLEHYFDFFYEYANDSGNVPSC
jgi:hypothetical protein